MTTPSTTTVKHEDKDFDKNYDKNNPENQRLERQRLEKIKHNTIKPGESDPPYDDDLIYEDKLVKNRAEFERVLAKDKDGKKTPEREVAEYFADNKDRILRDEKDLEILLGREIMYEKLAKDKTELGKIVSKEMIENRKNKLDRMQLATKVEGEGLRNDDDDHVVTEGIDITIAGPGVNHTGVNKDIKSTNIVDAASNKDVKSSVWDKDKDDDDDDDKKTPTKPVTTVKK